MNIIKLVLHPDTFQPLGIDSYKHLAKEMVRDSGLDVGNRKISNQSLRPSTVHIQVTSITALFIFILHLPSPRVKQVLVMNRCRTSMGM